MQQYIPAVASLVGVLIGGGLSFFGTVYGARKAFRREKDARLAGMRMAAYARFARAIKQESRLYIALAGTRDVGPADDPIDEETARDRLDVARRDRSDALEDLWIVGAPTVVEASRAWHASVTNLRKAVLTSADLSQEAFDRMNTALKEARENFYNAARSDLAIPGTVRILQGK